MTNNLNICDIFTNNNDQKWLQFPYEISDLPLEVNQKLLNDFTGERTGFVQVGPKKWFFPSGYKANAELYYNFQPRPDDVWIVTFPRSGTTQTQELTWLLANNLDYETARAKPLEERFPFLEFNSFVHPTIYADLLEENAKCEEKTQKVRAICAPAALALADMAGKRFIKTHLPFSLLPPTLLHSGCKVIYVARNPKDVAVSFYHLNKLFRTQGYRGDFPTYWNYFQNNQQPWTPYWSHVEEGWSHRANDNLLFMFYEDINRDFKVAINKVSNFLGKNYTDTELNILEDHLKIENFRENKSVNAGLCRELGITIANEQGFVRTGKNGASSEYFEGDLDIQADAWVENNQKRVQIKFPLT